MNCWGDLTYPFVVWPCPWGHLHRLVNHRSFSRARFDTGQSKCCWCKHGTLRTSCNLPWASPCHKDAGAYTLEACTWRNARCPWDTVVSVILRLGFVDGMNVAVWQRSVPNGLRYYATEVLVWPEFGSNKNNWSHETYACVSLYVEFNSSWSRLIFK